MRDHLEAFRARGVGVIAVGQGSGAEAAAFCDPLETGFDCYGDPERLAYRAFGLGRVGMLRMMVEPFVRAPALAWRRLRNADLAAAARPASDVKQLPGVAILDGAGVVRWLHRASQTDDLPTSEDVLRELARLGIRGKSASG